MNHTARRTLFLIVFAILVFYATDKNLTVTAGATLLLVGIGAVIVHFARSAQGDGESEQ